MSELIILSIGFVIGGLAVLFWQWSSRLPPFENKIGAGPSLKRSAPNAHKPGE